MKKTRVRSSRRTRRSDLHLYVHDENAVSVHALLAQLITQGRELLMASAEVKAALTKIDVATDNIAADIQRLKARVTTGMTDTEVAEVQAQADAIAAKLEGIAADPDNPDPVA